MPPEQTKPALARRLRIVGLVAGCAIALIVAKGIFAREDSSAQLRDWTDAQAIPTVAVEKPQIRDLDQVVEVPGRLEAYYRAPIYARVSGYVKSWKVDIGAPVTSGQLLAEIDAPDLDQQLLQARADLLNAQSAATLSATTLRRRQTLLSSNFVSQQEIDERSADLASKQAAVKSAEANVERLEALASYKSVAAPFDGVVTARNTDVGALINAGVGAGPAMFVISDVKKLRVYVDVPQNYVSAVKIGAKANIAVPEHAGRTFTAVVEASAQSVDVSSGTTQMQLALDNPNRELMPGGYASVRLKLERDVQPLHIPASALIFDKGGLRVATVGPDDRVLFKKVAVARDLGNEIEIASGLSAEDRVVVTPMDGVADGDPVHILDTANASKPAVASESGGAKN